MSVYLAPDSGLPTAHGASPSPSVIYQAWGITTSTEHLLPEAAPGLAGSLDPDGSLAAPPFPLAYIPRQSSREKVWGSYD